MNLKEIPPGSLIGLGVAGLAATALLGFAAGVIVARNPQALGQAARRIARDAALGLEQASLLAAQAREHLGDLWAEARDEARTQVDAADFARAATAAGASATANTADEAAPPEGAAPAPRRRGSRARSAGPADAGGDEPLHH
jgi:hypothetical protein